MKHLLWLLPLMLGTLIHYLNQGGSGPEFLAGLLIVLSIVAALFVRFEDQTGIIDGYYEVHTNDR